MLGMSPHLAPRAITLVRGHPPDCRGSAALLAATVSLDQVESGGVERQSRRPAGVASLHSCDGQEAERYQTKAHVLD